MAAWCAVAAATSAEDAVARNDSWYANLDVQWVERSTSAVSRSLAGHNAGTPGAPADDRSVLDTHDLRPDPVFEPELTMGYRLDDAWSFELSYFGLSSMNDHVSVSGPGDLDVPFTTAYGDNYRNASIVTARYETELRDVEFNVGFHATPNTTYLIGVGYVGLFEDLKLRAGSETQASSYTVQADNNLLGVHVGTDATIPLSAHWSFSARGRVGAFNNRSEYSHFLGDVGDTVTLRDVAERENNFAWRGEIGVAAAYQIAPGFSAWAGYRLSYVDNVLLAPDQVDLGTSATSGTTPSREGSALYHGPVIGVVVSFP